ncbi:MAG: hypothetical protein QME75_07950 [Deltaproteobacteria bacterium]|nr:hypothetical protein [Deltaproteobacteria bacterium]
MLKNNATRLIAAGFLAAALLLAIAPVQAQQGYYYQPREREHAYFERYYDREPSSAWMALDMAAARPIGVATTIGGIGLFVATLPLSVPSGTTADAAHGFIERPARWTFQRRLGRPGFDQHYFLP